MNFWFASFIDYVIPKGCFVVPFLSAVHLDETIYREASTFNPWRWMELKNQVSLFRIVGRNTSPLG